MAAAQVRERRHGTAVAEVVDMRNLDVTFKLPRLRCRDEADGIGPAEPYLWVTFVKVDGETVVVDETFHLAGTPTIVPRLSPGGDHGDLHDPAVRAGDVVTIPAPLDSFSTILKPIPLKTPIAGVTHIGGVIGCIAVLLEEDDTPEHAIAAGHTRLNDALRAEIQRVLATIEMRDQFVGAVDGIAGAVTGQVKDAIVGALGTVESITEFFGNSDDMIGAAALVAEHADLEAASSGGLDLRVRWADRFARFTQTSGLGRTSFQLTRGEYDRRLPGRFRVKLPRGWRVACFTDAAFGGHESVVDGSGLLPANTESFKVDQGEVVAFDQPDFQGNGVGFVSPGHVNGGELRPLTDNQIASLRIPADWRVTAFSERNFTGDRLTLTGDTPRIPAPLAGRISSLRLDRDDSTVEGDWELEAHVTGRRLFDLGDLDGPLPVLTRAG